MEGADVSVFISKTQEFSPWSSLGSEWRGRLRVLASSAQPTSQPHSRSSSSKLKLIPSRRMSLHKWVHRRLWIKPVLPKTLQEVQRGWPIPQHEVPSGSVVCRRFGLPQEEKTRLIDDMCPVNQTVSHMNPLALTRSTCWRRWARNSCRPALVSPFQGKAFDLAAAYRQLPLHPETAWTSFISVWDCQKRVQLPANMTHTMVVGMRSLFHSLDPLL